MCVIADPLEWPPPLPGLRRRRRDAAAVAAAAVAAVAAVADGASSDPKVSCRCT